MADIGTPVETQGISKSFGEVGVLRGVDLRIDRGTMFALLGPNGAGKTTIVRILSTLIDMDAGSARVHGYDIATQKHDVRRSIGLTGQFSAVDRLLTGRENLVMMGRLYHLVRRQATRRADELIEQFGLTDAADRPVKTYSGGMRRRLDLAASLIASPPVVFLDEPTTGLDPRSRNTMWGAIRNLLGSGVTILLTTQYLEEADQLAHRVGVLDNGRIVAEGTPDALKQQLGSERLELTFDDGQALHTALKAVDGASVRQAPEKNSLSMPIDGARDLKQILDLIDRAGVEIRTVALSKPTLDDVFLTLTGQPAVTATGTAAKVEAK